MAATRVQNLAGETAVWLRQEVDGGEVWCGAVRAFCERIGARGKRDGRSDWWPVKGAQRMVSWRRNEGGAARSHHTEEKGGVGLDKRAVAPQSRRARATFGQGRQ
jgi:hypothetical protein